MESSVPNVNYTSELGKCAQFLQKFRPLLKESDMMDIGRDDDGDIMSKTPKYLQYLQEVAAGTRTSVTIELDDIAAMKDELGVDFLANIQQNTFRYLDLFSKAIDSIIPTPTPQEMAASNDPINTIIGHRLLRQQSKQSEVNSPSERASFPPTLLRRFNVYIKPLSIDKALAVRAIKSADVGTLVKLRGVIVRMSEVKPLISVCTFTCDKCGFEIYQEVKSSAFTPLAECPSLECKTNNTKGELYMQTRGSKFLRFQELKLQELTDQVPMGHIPRSMTVHVYDELTRVVNPGDLVIVSGIYLPRPYTGFQAMKAGLLTDTYLHAMTLEPMKQKYTELVNDPNSIEKIISLSQEANIYGKLARSIAPEIYGMEDVKKTLLLMMAGGVSKQTDDGMRIRGDMNICLMGDPGVAKSQLLKYIARIAPRGVYTTGKGSSGVGLTAAVVKDPITNEMILEGGALVLADNGICCIDEFDKMDEGDRTAIHEVMEQQTISISKAGITTTLNARTSILAAANPRQGRYNVKLSPKDNINLPYALLSRFDILFLLLDRPDVDEDSRLADHVLHVHRTGSTPTTALDVVSPEILRQYIAHAKQFQPTIPQGLVDYLTGAYVSLRNTELLGKDFYTTPRTLTAIIRMSQALARLRFSGSVAQADVDEAMRLLDSSRASILLPLTKATSTFVVDPQTQIYSLIKCMPIEEESGTKVLSLVEIRQKLALSGFNEQQVMQAIQRFEKDGLWHLSLDQERLVFHH